MKDKLFQQIDEHGVKASELAEDYDVVTTFFCKQVANDLLYKIEVLEATIRTMQVVANMDAQTIEKYQKQSGKYFEDTFFNDEMTSAEKSINKILEKNKHIAGESAVENHNYAKEDEVKIVL